MVCYRPYPFKFFKGCLPQIILGPLLSTLSHITIHPDSGVISRETYFGPYQTFMMDRYCESTWWLKAINYFRNKVSPCVRQVSKF